MTARLRREVIIPPHWLDDVADVFGFLVFAVTVIVGAAS